MLPNLYLKTAKNQILPNCEAGATDDSLWLYLKNMTMAEAAQLAIDSEAIKYLEFHYGSLYSSYEGYTTVKIIRDYGKEIKVMLSGGHVVKEDAKYEGTLDGDGSEVVSDGDGSER